MKASFVLVFAFLAFCQAQNGIPTFNDLQQSHHLVGKESNLHHQAEPPLKTVHIVALINDYLDKLLENVRKLIIDHHLDPASLPDVLNLKVSLRHVNLTEGQLNDTSTIQRYQNATLTYDNDSKKLVAEMVLRFEDLKFIFKYHSQLGSISRTGHLHGEIEHVHVNLKLGFDFTDDSVFLHSIDFKHTGNVKVWLSGNAAIDWITNATMEAFTGTLHDLILNALKNMIAEPINAVVNAINALLHPSQ